MSVHRGCRHQRSLLQQCVERRGLLTLPDMCQKRSLACPCLGAGSETIPALKGHLQGFRLCERTPPSRKEVKTHLTVLLQVPLEVKALEV